MLVSFAVEDLEADAAVQAWLHDVHSHDIGLRMEVNLVGELEAAFLDTLARCCWIARPAAPPVNTADLAQKLQVIGNAARVHALRRPQADAFEVPQ